MKLGLFVVPLHFPERDLSECWEEERDLFVHADRLGFTEGWVGEHYCIRWENQPAPELLLAQAFALTRNIRLGTGVKVIGYHHPAVLAHKIAALDHLSGGRFMFGIGPGGTPSDFDMMGISIRDNEASLRMREAIEMMIAMWTSESSIEVVGDYWTLKVPFAHQKIGWEYHIRPRQRPFPPIAVAGTSPSSRTLGWGAGKGFLPMSFFDLNPESIRSQWDVISRGADEAGRTASRRDWRIARVVYVAETDTIARRHIRESSMPRAFDEYFRKVTRLFGGLGALKHDPSVPDEAVTSDYMIDNVWIVGGPETVRDRLCDFRDQVGPFGTLLLVHFDTHPHPERYKTSMRLLKEEVVPHLDPVSS